MSKQNMDSMRQWASEHSRQTALGSSEQHQACSKNSSSKHIYMKELPIGDRVTEEPSSADDIGNQLSEYDEDSATHEEEAVEAVPVNFLSRTVRTCRTGRLMTLSYRALSSY